MGKKNPLKNRTIKIIHRCGGGRLNWTFRDASNFGGAYHIHFLFILSVPLIFVLTPSTIVPTFSQVRAVVFLSCRAHTLFLCSIPLIHTHFWNVGLTSKQTTRLGGATLRWWRERSTQRAFSFNRCVAKAADQRKKTLFRRSAD